MSKKPQTEKIEKEVWRNRIVGRAEVLASELIPHPANWRTHPDGQRAALAAVLGEVGWVQDVVVNKATGRVLDGHLRREMAAEKGETVPVVYVDLTEAEERLILATFDPLSALAVPDDAKLRELLAEIEVANSETEAFFSRLIPDRNVMIDWHGRMTPVTESVSEPKSGDASRNIKAPVERMEILITCETEEQQAELLERFELEGIQCRALLS